MSGTCPGCVNTLEGVASLLGDARASLMRAQTYLRPTVIPEPRRVRAMRHEISGLWRQQTAIQARQASLRSSQPPLGLVWFVPAIAGASALVAALGAWAFKHREQAREVELRSELYNRMLEEGLSPVKAAALAMGAASPLAEVMGKLVVVSLVLGGLYVLVKVWK